MVEDNHIIKLMNPKVIKLNVTMVTHRKNRKGTQVRLKQPMMLLDALIAVTEPLTMRSVYCDEHNQQWLVMAKLTDVMHIRNLNQSIISFRMPTMLVQAYSTFSMDSSAQPQIEKVTFDEDWLALNDTI